MKISKITKFLPIALAFAMTTSGVFAAGGADANTNDSADYLLTLPDYLQIETKQAPTTTAVTYGADYSSATVDADLVGIFEVISNNNEQILYLKAECPTGTDGLTQALYGGTGDCSALKVVFTKTADSPSATEVENITKNTASYANNPNAIAFPLNIAISQKHNLEGESAESITPPSATWDTDKVKYTMTNGVATFTCTVTGSAEPNTFNTRDTDGTYKTTLTLFQAET